jgi:xylan 1,4-beta-xylosidase
VVYHAYENGYRTLGRQAVLEPVEWTADGWPRVTRRDLNLPIRSPRGGQNVGSGQPLSDNFSTNRIGTLWRFYRAGQTEMSRVAYGEGGLTLQGKGTTFADCSPLTCIPVDRAYEVTLEAELIDQVEAGLMLFIGSTLYAGIGHDGTRVKSYNKGGPARGQQEPTPTRRIWVKLVNDHQIMEMYTSLDGHAWTRYPLRLEVSGYHQNVTPGGGESLRIGLYAIGAGKARLRNFTYKALA